MDAAASPNMLRPGVILDKRGEENISSVIIIAYFSVNNPFVRL